jgi:hypothetical protein
MTIRGWSLLRIWIALSCVWIAGVAVVGSVQWTLHKSQSAPLIADQIPASNLCVAIGSSHACKGQGAAQAFGPGLEVAPEPEMPTPMHASTYVGAALLGPSLLLVIWMIIGWVIGAVQKHQTEHFLD